MSCIYFSDFGISKFYSLFFFFNVGVKFIPIRKILMLMLCLRMRVLLQKHWKGNFISLMFEQNYSKYESILSLFFGFTSD